MSGDPKSVLATTLEGRGYKRVEPLKSASGQAFIFRVQEVDDDAAEQYVAKVVSLTGLDAKGRASAQQEVSLLKGLSAHPNLIAYRESFMEAAGQLYIVMSLADGGDLRSVVAEAKQTGRLIPEPIVLSWVMQTVSGLHHLHSQGVVHRDLKSSNIFLCEGRRRIRIGDFGISRVLESTAFATSCVGTPAYMSPEQMRSERYDHHVDMWAMGCIIFEVCTLELPFPVHSLLDLALQVLEGEPQWHLWVGYSEELRDICVRLLYKDPEARPAAQDLLGEPLFAPGGRGAEPPSDEAWASIASKFIETGDIGDGTSTDAESSVQMSRAEFAQLLASHHGQMLTDFQSSRGPGLAPRDPGGGVGGPPDGKPVAESVV